jgi:hypothetical protein
MNFHDLTTEAYAKLHTLFGANDTHLALPFLGYEYPTSQTDFIYQWQEDDFTRELVNAFNQYAYWLTRLVLWERVLKDYSDENAEALRYEFTKLPLDHCLHFPYRFRSKLTFCATQLCYTKAIAAKTLSKALVKSDERINLETLVAVVQDWKSGPLLVEALKAIDGESFRQATFNYRNKAQHRHAQRLDYGHVANIVRSFPESSLVSYSFGQLPPILAGDVLPVLVAEGERLKAGFNAFRALVNEHASAKSDA